MSTAVIRHDWTRAEIAALFDLAFPDLIFHAQRIHRENFDPAEVQVSTLLSIKTGGCPEDCAYCPQSAHYDTGVNAEKLMRVDAVIAEARAAKRAGASRFCMGAAWREPKDRDLDKVCEMVAGVKAAGLETCATLGMLTGEQAQRLGRVGTAHAQRLVERLQAEDRVRVGEDALLVDGAGVVEGGASRATV
jgi:biotin synthase